MRRGGGSRGGGGGSRGGGSRGGSRGGGSRGGGFRGGSSRMHRSSRRHYRHRSYYGPRYYGPRYYGGGYYGGRRRYYGGGGIGGLLIFLFIVMLIVAVFVAGSFSGTDTVTIQLAPQTTFPVEYTPFSDGDVNVDVTNGAAIVYSFDEQPNIDSTIDSFETFSGTLVVSDDYNWFALSLSEGTEVIVNWSADGAITYYAIRGDSNLDSWETGSNSQFYDDFGISGTHSYTVSQSDIYYFAVEASSFGNVDYNIDFVIKLPVLNLDNPNNQWSGSNYISESEIDGNSLVFYNPSSTEDASIDVEIASNFSFGQVFLGIMVVTIGLLVLIKKRSDSKSKSSQSQDDDGSPQVEGVEDFSGEKPAKSMEEEPEFVSRAPAKFCANCGSGLIPDSKFCIECGQSA